jgi:hypothetical protein
MDLIGTLSSLATLYSTVVAISAPCVVTTVVEGNRARTTLAVVVLLRKHHALEHRKHYMRNH